MFHSALDQPFCPVKALAQRTHYLYTIAPEDASLPSKGITLAVRESVVLSSLLNLGYSPLRVSAHPYEPAGPWHSVSTTSAKISSKKSDAGPVPRGSLTSTPKFLRYPQASQKK
jgi:hypothetical protein